MAVWCDGGAIYTYDCAGDSQGCGWANDQVGYTCVSGCGDLDWYGDCFGDSLRWCQDGAVAVADCAASGRSCGWQDDTIGYNCL